jgi:hypothetical protein
MNGFPPLLLRMLLLLLLLRFLLLRLLLLRFRLRLRLRRHVMFNLRLSGLGFVSKQLVAIRARADKQIIALRKKQAVQVMSHAVSCHGSAAILYDGDFVCYASE